MTTADTRPRPAPAEEPLEERLATLRAEDLGAAPATAVVEAVAEMVAHPEYPCLGARSVFRRDAVTSVVLDDLTDTSPGGSLDLLGEHLRRFAASADPEGDLASFAACFRGPADLGEKGFEDALWSALRHLHERDGDPWPESVSADPANPHFAFAVGGTAFFVVGMHPDASRIARRSPLPVLVFNLHEQFERLRSDGRFAKMRDTIRRRDTELQGSLNPMVADHGQGSEARQYAGREVPPGWIAPFTPDPAPEEHP